MSLTAVPSDIEWRKEKTYLGKDYEIGFLRGSQPQPKDPRSLPSFAVPVNWSVAHAGAWNEWKATSNEVQERAAISRYNLYEYIGANWRFMLQFTNRAHYTYYFEDQTGDRYRVDTWRNGDHYLRYNSDHPTIILVDGS
ncbi:hypothetical protein BDV93DRAFT_526788 [Ceratobasidium sp. AG-I]|nr:hypothetical protein BDV93DRAFT_526788 [Ceratobasidium sp. AG-I]